jgi:hypothetical protein
MRRVSLVVLMVSWLAPHAGAVTVVPLTFAELVNKSEAVVFGRVVDVRGDFTGDRRGIESAVTLEVMRGIKGRQGETITFTVPGGQAGRYLNVIPGAPVFARGDLAVVFLSSRGARLPVTTGLTQGVYRVQRAAAGDWLVMPPVGEGAASRIVRGDAQRRPVPLAAFESSVRAVMDAAR